MGLARLVLVLVLLPLLLSTAASAQSINLDDVLPPPDDESGTGGDLLDEGNSRKSYDPLDELNSVPSARLKKKIVKAKTESKKRDSRMLRECGCFIPIEDGGNLCLEVTRLNPKTGGAYVYTKEEKASFARAKARKKELCRAWNKGRKTGDDAYLRQIEALERERDAELATEEELKRQRRDAAARKREQITRELQPNSPRRSPSQPPSRRDERLQACQAMWAAGRNPCECYEFRSAREDMASTCEK